MTACRHTSVTSPTPPSSLTLSVDLSALTRRNATAQVRAVVSGPGQTDAEVTSACKNWTSTDSTVAVVSETGVLTAQGSGSTVIMAMCERGLAQTRVTLALIDAVPEVTLSAANYDYDGRRAWVIVELMYQEIGHSSGFNFHDATLRADRLTGPQPGLAMFWAWYSDVWSHHWAPGAAATVCWGIAWEDAAPQPAVQVRWDTMLRDSTFGTATSFSGTVTVAKGRWQSPTCDGARNVIWPMALGRPRQ